MDWVFCFLLWPKREARGPWKQGRKKRGSITCFTDRANEANKMFIIWLCWLFRFWKDDRELEVRTATYGPGIDQSQHAKSVSHIIKTDSSQHYMQIHRTSLCTATRKPTISPRGFSFFRCVESDGVRKLTALCTQYKVTLTHPIQRILEKKRMKIVNWLARSFH